MSAPESKHRHKGERKRSRHEHANRDGRDNETMHSRDHHKSRSHTLASKNSAIAELVRSDWLPEPNTVPMKFAGGVHYVTEDSKKKIEADLAKEREREQEDERVREERNKRHHTGGKKLSSSKDQSRRNRAHAQASSTDMEVIELSSDGEHRPNRREDSSSTKPRRSSSVQSTTGDENTHSVPGRKRHAGKKVPTRTPVTHRLPSSIEDFNHGNLERTLTEGDSRDAERESNI